MDWRRLRGNYAKHWTIAMDNDDKALEKVVWYNYALEKVVWYNYASTGHLHGKHALENGWMWDKTCIIKH